MEKRLAEERNDSFNDLFGKALYDFYQGRFQPPLVLHNTYGDPEEIPVEGYFFDENQISEMEDFALSLCRGRILDAGAAAGRHVMILQDRGLDVTGLEVSRLCCNLMRARGVRKVVHGDIHKRKAEGFDTVMMLMNGIGLAGSVEGLRKLLLHLKQIVHAGGQIIFDSSDISYVYEQTEKPADRYFGEMDYRYEYRGQKGEWFSWLYIDSVKMKEISAACGWHLQVIYEDQTETYLGRLVRFD